MNIYILAFVLLLQGTFAFGQALDSSQSHSFLDSRQVQPGNNAENAKIIYKSTDGGQTWQDISEGLPGNLLRDGFFANESGAYLRAGNGLYHRTSNSTAPFWKKEIFPDEHSSIAPARSGMYAYNNNGQFLQKTTATSSWAPVYTNFKEKEIRNIFETSAGTIFIGCNNGLFRSTDKGKNWKQIQTGGWAMKVVESNGVLIATCEQGIIRSTDNGETWNTVISEGGVGIAIEVIKGGFAAITYNSQSETRRVRTSYDGGKTWQAIDAGLPASPSISSIIQVGNYFYCGHPAGIFRSSDKGKTWKLLVPSTGNKVFKLSVSGNVIYAILVEEGC